MGGRLASLAVMRRYTRNPDLAARVILNEAYLVVPETNMMYVLNEPGSVLWSALESPKTEEELTDALCEVFEVSWDEALKDVREFLEEMVNTHLILPSPLAVPDHPLMSSGRGGG